MRVVLIMVLQLVLMAAGGPAQAAEATRPGCDACQFEIATLDRPFSAAGTWLFTRDDAPENRLPGIDTSRWTLVKAPGPWRTAYDDGTRFRVGWYRGVLRFAPELLGQDIVFMVDTYMARTTVYVDGVEVFKRPGNANVDRYYSIQPIPVRFRVTQPEHVIAIRVDTWLMTGIYQLPFEVRQYDPHDWRLVLYQFEGAEVRLVAGAVALFFGLFFLLVHWKTHYGLYLYASLTGLVISPFFVLPTDYLLRLFNPDVLFFLHYPGLVFGYFIFLFSQYYHRPAPRLNWVFGVVFAATSLVIAAMAVAPDLEIFLKARSLHLLMLLITALASGYMILRGVISRKPGARILFGGMLVFLASGINDFLLANGIIDSFGTMTMGVFAYLSALLFVASSIFANTFRENRELVVSLRSLNDNLETLVAERTRELASAVDELGVANGNLSQSYEQLRRAKDELVRSEKLAALGSLVAGIAHELNTPLGNGLMAATTLHEETGKVRAQLEAKTLRSDALDAYVDTVEAATDIALRSLKRSATLVASFKQIAVDQTASHRSPFALVDVVTDVTTVLQPSLKGKPIQLDIQVPGNIQLDSYPGPLGQVLTNCIQNAMVHAFDSQTRGVIRVVAEIPEEDRVVIRVIDDGKGIAVAHLPKLFDPFFTTSLGKGGSGLGLHIAHNIVTQMLGGTLTAKTQAGVGSEFIVDIPAAAPSAGQGAVGG